MRPFLALLCLLPSPALAQCVVPSLSVSELQDIIAPTLAFLATCWLVKTLGGVLRA